MSSSVDAGVDDSNKEVIEDVGEAHSFEHAEESSQEHRLLRVQPLTGAPALVAVTMHPGDDLNLLAAHPPAGHPEVPGPSTAGVVVGALGVEGGRRGLTLKDGVEVAFRWRGKVALPCPLNPDGAELSERLDQALLDNVPGDPAREDLGAVDMSGREHGLAALR